MGCPSCTVLLEQQGRHVAPVPIWQSALAAPRGRRVRTDAAATPPRWCRSGGGQQLPHDRSRGVRPYVEGNRDHRREANGQGPSRAPRPSSRSRTSRIARSSRPPRRPVPRCSSSTSRARVSRWSRRSPPPGNLGNVTLESAPRSCSAPPTAPPRRGCSTVSSSRSRDPARRRFRRRPAGRHYLNGSHQFGRPLAPFRPSTTAGRLLHRPRGHARDAVARPRGCSPRGRSWARRCSSPSGGPRRRPARGAPHHARARRHGCRHRLPRAPAPAVGQADRATLGGSASDLARLGAQLAAGVEVVA